MAQRLAFLLLFLLAGQIGAGCGRDAPLDTLLVTADTLRADYLSTYGLRSAPTGRKPCR